MQGRGVNKGTQPLRNDGNAAVPVSQMQDYKGRTAWKRSQKCIRTGRKVFGPAREKNWEGGEKMGKLVRKVRQQNSKNVDRQFGGEQEWNALQKRRWHGLRGDTEESRRKRTEEKKDRIQNALRTLKLPNIGYLKTRANDKEEKGSPMEVNPGRKSLR